MIITISGQYGSGGNEIGQLVAEELGYRILDAELVIRARELFDEATGGECPEWWPSRSGKAFNEDDDIPVPGTAYAQAKFRLQTDLITSTEMYEALGPVADSIREAMLDAQARAIMEYIEGGDCIIFGKCSNFILRGREDVINVFTKADMDTRASRIMDHFNFSIKKVKEYRGPLSAYMLHETETFYNMSKETAVHLIESTDERRAACYEFITKEKWGDESTFDYVFDGSDKDLTPFAKQLIEKVKGE